MKVVVNAIATLGILNESGVLDLDVPSSKSVPIGELFITNDLNKRNPLPGENDIIK